MTENTRRVENSLPSQLLQKWNDLDLKNAAAPLLQFADIHPFITLFIGILTSLSVLPFVIFTTFVTTTFMLTLLGFLLIEGTMLSIATFILAFTLFGVVCSSVVLTALFVVVWLVFATGSVGIQRLKQIIKDQVSQLHQQRLSNRLNGIGNKTS